MLESQEHGADERTATAYHEAGHAVMALYLQMPSKYVTIIPDKENNLGHVAYRFESEPDTADIVWLHRRVLTALAGPAAESKYTGCDMLSSDGAAGDREECAVFASEEMQGEEASAFIAWLNLRATRLIGSPNIWAAVERVASALLERGRLSEDEAAAAYAAPRATI